MIFLFLLFVTESSKVIFLILWIVSLFVIASYLIVVEYMDYNLQEKIKEFTGDEDAEFDGLGQVPMTFIRAPYIAQAGEGVEILAEVDGKIVAARQGRQLVTAFHPELDGDARIHEYFLNM